MRKSVFYVSLMAMAMVLFSGCSFVEDNPNTARLTTQYATVKVIDGDSARAARIVEITSQIKLTIAEDTSATISALNTYVRGEIRWEKLTPEDTILIDAVLLNAVARLEEEVSAGLLDPDQRIQLTTFLTWIEEVAARYQEA